MTVTYGEYSRFMELKKNNALLALTIKECMTEEEIEVILAKIPESQKTGSGTAESSVFATYLIRDLLSKRSLAKEENNI